MAQLRGAAGQENRYAVGDRKAQVIGEDRDRGDCHRARARGTRSPLLLDTERAGSKRGGFGEGALKHQREGPQSVSEDEHGGDEHDRV